MNFLNVSVLLCFFLLLNLLGINNAAKILFIVVGGTKSHKIFYNGITKALAQANHQITMISPFGSSSEVENIREIVLSNNFVEKVVSNAFETSNFDNFKNFLQEGPKACVDSMLEEEVQKILKEEEFDLFILPLSMSDCYLPYIYSTKVPFIFTFPNVISGPYSDIMGTLDMPSVSPVMVMESHFPLTFVDRMKSVLASFVTYILVMIIFNKRVEEETRKRGFYPEDSPSITEIEKNASLAIINSFQALEQPQRPYNLNIICAGGIHIDPQGNVPKDLQEWMDGAAQQGFILFSLGSHANPAHMKKEHQKLILKVFDDLKLNVLWKWDGQMEGLTSNSSIKLVKWLPQQHVLAHPNIRLFITHGGLLSTQESTYFGVPVLGMPIFADQLNNIAQVVAQGWGKRLNWKTLTEEKFKKLLLESLQDESLKKIVSERAVIMKDQQRSPAEEVVFWVEYVIRHKGAYHLQSPLRNMSLVEIYNIDVWATLILFAVVTLLVMIYASLKVISILYNCCRKPKHKKLKDH